MNTSTEILIKALRILAEEIESDDGVANATIAEAADRLEYLNDKIDLIYLNELNTISNWD